LVIIFSSGQFYIVFKFSSTYASTFSPTKQYFFKFLC